jgi:RNA polymerase sigma-70 factor, ECF subfamily
VEKTNTLSFDTESLYYEKRKIPDCNNRESTVADRITDTDPGGFRALVERHKNAVMSICFRFLGNREDAEDAAQETFIEIYRSLAGFRNESQVSTWIYRIAVTKALDYRRKKRRMKRFGIVMSIFGLDEGEEAIPRPVSENPDIVLEQSERARILRDAVNSIPENQKIAISLSEYEHFSNKEIADIMGVSLSAVESLLHRARKSLHKKLFGYYEKQLI